jgi:hypothetical protein
MPWPYLWPLVLGGEGCAGRRPSPLAWAWGDLSGSGLCVLLNRDPVLFDQLQIYALVETEAVGGAHAKSTPSMGKLDLLHGLFDLPVFGYLALSELVDSLTTGRGEQVLTLEAD